MTVQEKAKGLVDTYRGLSWLGYDRDEEIPKEVCKECVLIAVKETLVALHKVMMSQPDSGGNNLSQINFYKKVYIEISGLSEDEMENNITYDT